jgi:putative transposase
VVDNSLSGERVARELDWIAEQRGYPFMIVSDNGTELTSNAILAWQEERQVDWLHCTGQADAERSGGELYRPT